MAGSISAQTAINIRVWGRSIGITDERIDDILSASKAQGVAWTVDASPTADAALVAHLVRIFRGLGFYDEVADRFIAAMHAIGPANQLLNALGAAPNLVDMPFSAVEDTLRAAGYVLGTVTRTADQGNHRKEAVVTQSVAAAHTDVAGTAINVVLQKGQTVPAAANVLKATFLTALGTVGLVAGTETTAHHATIAAGNLISCSPAAGSFVEYGSAVAYVRSLGV